MSTTQFAIPGLMPPAPRQWRQNFIQAAPDGSLRMPIYRVPADQSFHDFRVIVTNQSGNILFADYRRSHVHRYLTSGMADYWLILEAGVLPVGTHKVHVSVAGFSAKEPCRHINYEVHGVLVQDTPWVAAGRSRYGVDFNDLASDNALQDLVAQIIRTQAQVGSGGSGSNAELLEALYGRLDVLTETIVSNLPAQGTPPNIHFSTGGLVYQATVGNGSDVSFLIPHNMSTTNVLVQAFATDVLYPYGQLVDCDVTIVDSKNVLVTFATPPGVSGMRVMIVSGAAPEEPGAPIETILSRNVTDLVNGVRVDFSHAEIDRAIAVTLNGIVQTDVSFAGNTATLDRAPQVGDVLLLIGADVA